KCRLAGRDAREPAGLFLRRHILTPVPKLQVLCAEAGSELLQFLVPEEFVELLLVLVVTEHLVEVGPGLHPVDDRLLRPIAPYTPVYLIGRGSHGARGR